MSRRDVFATCLLFFVLLANASASAPRQKGKSKAGLTARAMTATGESIEEHEDLKKQTRPPKVDANGGVSFEVGAEGAWIDEEEPLLREEKEMKADHTSASEALLREESEKHDEVSAKEVSEPLLREESEKHDETTTKKASEPLLREETEKHKAEPLLREEAEKHDDTVVKDASEPLLREVAEEDEDTPIVEKAPEPLLREEAESTNMAKFAEALLREEGISTPHTDKSTSHHASDTAAASWTTFSTNVPNLAPITRMVMCFVMGLCLVTMAVTIGFFSSNKKAISSKQPLLGEMDDKQLTITI